MSVLLALSLDWIFGEPPTWLHPVVAMGRYLKWAGNGLTKRAPSRAFFAGTVAWLLGACTVVTLALLAVQGLARLPWWARVPLLAVLLKPMFAFRMLLREVMAVETALERSLEDGRARLAFIVSRDVSKLSAAEVRESALESVSENLSDSLVAPLFWFVVAGLPGAALYRYSNTADAMWGYRGEWEWAGKWAARCDDVLNFIPARLTGAGLLLLGARKAKNTTSLVREAAKTPSPNSGWPMAALAIALGVRLGKPGVYVLNPEGHAPEASDVKAGLRRATVTGWAFGILFSLVVAWLWEVQHG